MSSTEGKNHRIRGRGRSLRTTALGYVLAALVSGCATHSDDVSRPAGISLPAIWSDGSGAVSATGQPADIARWWQHFNDPLLTTLVTDALENSPDLHAAQASLAQGRAARRAARSGLFPSLDATASAQRSHGSAQTGAGTTTDRYAAGFDANWEPDLFGSTRHAVDAADAGVAASAAALQATRVALAAEVAIAYIDLRSAQARFDIATQNLAAQDETLALTGWRAEAGLASSLDTEQARTAREQTRAQLAALDAALATTEHRLAVLCGKPPAALHDLLAPRTPIPATASDVPTTIPADTLRRRPDVRAAEWRLQADSARVDAARAARWPSLRISGSIGVAALTAGGLTAGDAGTNTLLGSIALPLFDAGRLRAQVAVQLAVREQTLASYQSTVLAALQDVEDALVNVRTSRVRVDALRNASEAAGNAMRLARQRYEAGSIDFQSLLDTQRTALAVDDGLAVAHADEAAAQVRLYKSLGGGWQPDEDEKK